ncbi:efflux RND transporter periplasmic adaptor subunit [Ferrovibrio sp.]|uniref:efflux RND transporter periplasmic adaptor subunit n=1 Tax=Ferrovibrio sp. TaxID=1917215 RepID=UPI00261BEF0E|nr:efflux RND transporter periplasmic adaptor subunit [Ferrovibrio sp.]
MKQSYILMACAVAVAGAAAGGYWFGTQRPKQMTPATTVMADAGQPAAPAQGSDRKLLYYRNPMGLPDVSPTPKKDWMGMDYIPVYEGEEQDTGEGIKISLDKVQKLGVRTEPAARRNLMRPVRATGTMQFDERRQVDVTVKYEGWIEKLLVNATGEPVKAGQTLMLIYSPALVQAQEEYLVAKRLRDEGTADADRLMAGAMARMRNFDVPKTVLDRLARDGTVSRQIALASPIQGVVAEKNAVEGMRLMPGERLYRLIDDRQVWLLADVFEQDLGLLKPGIEVGFTVNAYPDRRYTGRIAYIYPTLNRETRTARVRIEVPNADGALKADMYATVDLQTAAAMQTVAVPESAVLDTGTKQVVLVDMGQGRFEPRIVKLGARGDGYAAVLDGIFEDEPVVVSANFLIDAESNLKAALSAFTADQGAPK